MSAPTTPTPDAAPRRPARSRTATPTGTTPVEPGPPVQEGADWTSWPTYNSAAHGFRNYWYPTIWAHQVGDDPVPITLDRNCL